MNTPQLRNKLLQLTTPQIKRLAQLADVSERALWKIRSGETKTASESLRDAACIMLRKVRRRDHEMRGTD